MGYCQALFKMTTVKKAELYITFGAVDCLKVDRIISCLFGKRSVAIIVYFYSHSSLIIVRTLLAESLDK